MTLILKNVIIYRGKTKQIQHAWYLAILPSIHPFILSVYLSTHPSITLRACSVVSDSLPPQGLQPTRLLQPWDFPGKNTGVNCCFLLQGVFPTQGLTCIPCASCVGRQILHHCATSITICYLSMCVRVLSCVRLCDLLDYSPPGSSVHGIFQARILEWVVTSFSMTQGSNPRLLCLWHCRRILYCLSHQGSPYLCMYVCIVYQK